MTGSPVFKKQRRQDSRQEVLCIFDRNHLDDVECEGTQPLKLLLDSIPHPLRPNGLEKIVPHPKSFGSREYWLRQTLLHLAQMPRGSLYTSLSESVA